MKNKIFNFLYLKYLRYFRKYVRLSSEPYISGDTFRKHSKHVRDEISQIDYSAVEKNDIVFIKTDYLDEFLDNEINKIKNYFILITHNSDYPITKKHTELLGNKNIKWFAQNLSFDASKDLRFEPLPIGLENRSFLKHGKIKNFDIFIPDKNKKNNKIYCSFNTLTNKKRIDVLNCVKENKLTDIENFSNHRNYIKKLSNYKFSICPIGNGLDTHRFWESISVHTLPIVENSEFIQNFNKLGVPMLILENWNDIENINEATLINIYEDNYKKFNTENFLSIEFWINKIKSSQIK